MQGEQPAHGGYDSPQKGTQGPFRAPPAGSLLRCLLPALGGWGPDCVPPCHWPASVCEMGRRSTDPGVDCRTGSSTVARYAVTTDITHPGQLRVVQKALGPGQEATVCSTSATGGTLGVLGQVPLPLWASVLSARK